MPHVKDWNLDSDDVAGGVTLDSDTITLGGRHLLFINDKVAKPTAVFTKEDKPTSSWTKVAKPPIVQ